MFKWTIGVLIDDPNSETGKKYATEPREFASEFAGIAALDDAVGEFCGELGCNWLPTVVDCWVQHPLSQNKVQIRATLRECPSK